MTQIGRRRAGGQKVFFICKEQFKRPPVKAWQDPLPQKPEDDRLLLRLFAFSPIPSPR